MQNDDEDVRIDSSTDQGPSEDTMNSMKMNEDSRRRAHFKNGGTLKQWNGNPKTFTDRKKESRRNRCRGKVADDE